MKIHTLLFQIILCIVPYLNYAQISFLENKGQWDEKVLFKSVDQNNSFFLTKDGYTMLLQDAKDARLSAEYTHQHHTASAIELHGRTAPIVKSHAYKVKFLQANADAQVVKDKALMGYENFFIGNDASKWATACKSYQSVTYKNIYNGIDLVYYVKDNQLKYDLIIYPGADLSQVQLRYDGASNLQLRHEKLVVGTSVGEVEELKPYTYQLINGKQESVQCKYRLKDQTISFEVADYNREQVLVIDPSIVFSSYSKSTADNWGMAATYGADGSFFGASVAQTTGFPVTTGAIQSTGAGPAGSGVPPDIAIIKLSADGTTRVFATYLGGNGLEQPNSLIADAAGNLIIAGRTNSGASFPGNLIGPGGAYDMFVTKINATGTAIIGSTKVGGSGDDGVNISAIRSTATSLVRNYGDDTRSEVLLDANNNIFFAASTRSVNFPVINGFQNTLVGSQDAVVIKLDPDATTLTWSTLLGGSANDAAFSLAINTANGACYVAGGTTSSTIPGTLSTSLQSTYNGGVADGYISKLQDNGSSVSLIASTFLGTANVDCIYGVKLDKSGNPYVTGTSTGIWPVMNATYSVSNARQFIAKVQPDLSAFIYSTTFGVSGSLEPNLSPVAFFVDDCENVYVTGWGGGANTFGTGFPTSGTTGLPVTPDALQTATDGSDFYIFVLQKNATAQLYGSFLGQNGGAGAFDHAEGGTSRFDPQGVLYLAACANCKSISTGLPAVSPFPITDGVFGDTNPATASGCNLGMVKIRFDYAGSNCIITSDVLVRNEAVATLSFFPNPGKGKLMMRYDNSVDINSPHNLRIYDAHGKIVCEQHFIINRSGSQLMIDMSGKGTGMYFVELINTKGNRLATGKFMIE
jgi:hypothetical protein